MEVKDALALMISFGALHIALIGLIVTVMALNQSKRNRPPRTRYRSISVDKTVHSQPPLKAAVAEWRCSRISALFNVSF